MGTLSPSRLLRPGIAALLVVVASAAHAGFHDGGVAACGGCHVTHASVDGTDVVAGEGQLRADSATDPCLLCHDAGPASVLGSSVFDTESTCWKRT